MNELIKLENAVKEYEQVDIEVIHKFTEDMYIRQAIIPKGLLIVGKRHRHETLNMLLKGRMIIYDGNESIEVIAPFIIVSKPFTKKAGIALEDSIWCNIHVTTNRNLEEIEKEFIIPEEEFNNILEYKEQTCLG